jgi:hypothetical protein
VTMRAGGLPCAEVAMSAFCQRGEPAVGSVKAASSYAADRFDSGQQVGLDLGCRGDRHIYGECLGGGHDARRRSGPARRPDRRPACRPAHHHALRPCR